MFNISLWQIEIQMGVSYRCQSLSNIKHRARFLCLGSCAEVGSLMYCCGSIKWYSHFGIKCLTERVVGKDCGLSCNQAWGLLWSAVCLTVSVCLSWLCDWELTLQCYHRELGTWLCFLLLPSSPPSLLHSFSHLRNRVFLCILSWPRIHHSPASPSRLLGLQLCTAQPASVHSFFPTTYELYNYPVIKLNLKTGLSLKWLYCIVNGSLWNSISMINHVWQQEANESLLAFFGTGLLKGCICMFCCKCCEPLWRASHKAAVRMKGNHSWWAARLLTDRKGLITLSLGPSHIKLKTIKLRLREVLQCARAQLVKMRARVCSQISVLVSTVNFDPILSQKVD